VRVSQRLGAGGLKRLAVDCQAEGCEVDFLAGSDPNGEVGSGVRFRQRWVRLRCLYKIRLLVGFRNIKMSTKRNKKRPNLGGGWPNEMVVRAAAYFALWLLCEIEKV
jgi:hypothetical protein